MSCFCKLSASSFCRYEEHTHLRSGESDSHSPVLIICHQKHSVEPALNFMLCALTHSPLKTYITVFFFREGLQNIMELTMSYKKMGHMIQPFSAHHMPSFLLCNGIC